MWIINVKYLPNILPLYFDLLVEKLCCIFKKFCYVCCYTIDSYSKLTVAGWVQQLFFFSFLMLSQLLQSVKLSVCCLSQNRSCHTKNTYLFYCHQQTCISVYLILFYFICNVFFSKLNYLFHFKSWKIEAFNKKKAKIRSELYYICWIVVTDWSAKNAEEWSRRIAATTNAANWSDGQEAT